MEEVKNDKGKLLGKYDKNGRHLIIKLKGTITHIIFSDSGEIDSQWDEIAR